MYSVTPALSLIGVVFGMQATAVKPPATAEPSRRHRFLVLLARLAQMHVHVEQSGCHDEARRYFDDGRAIDGRSLPTRTSRSPSIRMSNVHRVSSPGRRPARP
jgi:hypothetical protein